MKKNVIIVLIVTLVGMVILVGLFILSKQIDTKITQVFLENNNIIAANTNRSFIREITHDGSGSKGVKYTNPIILGDTIRYIRCLDSVVAGDNNKCSIEEFSIKDTSTSSLFDLSFTNYINLETVEWNKSNGDLVFASRKELLLFSDNNLKSILNWEVLDLGIGGNFCIDTEFDTSYQYFYFCDAAAVGLSIQGNLYVFKSSGELVKEFKPSKEKQNLGIIEPEFEDLILDFKDSSNNMSYSYNITDGEIIVK